MLFCGAFTVPHKANMYYGEKRGAGVTHPGQQRYLDYFLNGLEKGTTPLPRKKRLLSISFFGIPTFSGKTCKPIIEIYDIRKDEKVCCEQLT